MTTTIDHGRALGALLRRLKSKYRPSPPTERSPLEELVYSFLLFDAPSNKADAAYRRLMHHVVDVNELRVCRPDEVSSVLGKLYPLAEERAQRLQATLHEVFLREFAVSLDRCAGLNKREARAYLDTLDGMHPFVSARVMLLSLGGHAVPVDQRLLDRLIAGGIVEADYDCQRVGGVLERHVKADEARQAHLLLLAWCDDPASEPAKVRSVRPGAPAASGAGRGRGPRAC